MYNFKQKLLDLDIVIDNSYLDAYVELINKNNGQMHEVYKTQKHHIVPRVYFRHFNLDIDNSADNIVNLYHKDHLLAHYFLAKCAKEGWFESANLYAIRRFINNKFTEDELYHLLPDYQIMKEQTAKYMGALHKGKKMSVESRQKMSASKKGCEPWNKGIVGIIKNSEEVKNKKREAQIRVWAENKDNPIFRTKGKKLNVSKTGHAAKHNAILGKKIYHNGDDEKYFYPTEIIPDGWILGRSIRNIELNRHGQSGKKMSSESSKKKAKSMIGRKVYNNGIENKKFFPDKVPEGFILGYLKKEN